MRELEIRTGGVEDATALVMSVNSVFLDLDLDQIVSVKRVGRFVPDLLACPKDLGTAGKGIVQDEKLIIDPSPEF